MLAVSPISVQHEVKVVVAENLIFWTESFGNKKNPALVLIMGSGGQGILWPQYFCEELARRGYYVIRYDHRDTGLSSTINYQKTPYTLLDMAKDVIAIIDHYGLEKTHVVGASMGGPIAMLLGGHYPERISSLVLMMTSVDMRPVFDAFLGLKPSSHLSRPTDAVLAVAKKTIVLPETMEEKVNYFIENVMVNSGGKISIDEEACRQIALQVFVRMKNPKGMTNHFYAAQASYDIYSQAATQIKAPTAVIHGDSDPVFPLDHAYAIQQAISDSSLAIIPGLGHGLSNAVFFGPVIEKIVEGTRRLELSRS